MGQAGQGRFVAVRVAARAAAADEAARQAVAVAEAARWRPSVFDAMDDLDGFAHRVSHDLRGPLYGMCTLSGLIQSRLDEGDLPQVRQWVAMIGQHSQRLGDMVTAIVDLLQAAGAVPSMQRVALSELVAEVRHAQPAPPAAVVRVATLPVLRVDPALIGQVFARLLDNAYKFSRGNPRPRIDLRCENLGRHWRFQVRDNGCGFAPERTDELFHPFARLHGSEFEGSGMGLSVVRRIVALHGGQAWADGAEGRGATFSFTLPG